MSSIITATQGSESLEIVFDGYDVDEETTFTCTGTKDTVGLLEWLNWLATIYGSNDGISGLYTETETPRALIKAFRLTGYAITIPEYWENMDDGDDQLGETGGVPTGDNY